MAKNRDHIEIHGRTVKCGLCGSEIEIGAKRAFDAWVALHGKCTAAKNRPVGYVEWLHNDEVARRASEYGIARERYQYVFGRDWYGEMVKGSLG